MVLAMHPNTEWSLVWLDTQHPGEIIVNQVTKYF